MTRVVVTDVVLEVEADVLSGPVSEAAVLRELANCLAQQGFVVNVLHEIDPPLPRPGDVSTRTQHRRPAGRLLPLGTTQAAGRPGGNLPRHRSEEAPMLWVGGPYAGVRPPGRLLEDGLLIGSDPECDLVLSGIEPVQAQVRHEDGTWLVRVVAGVTRVDGIPVVGQVLRDGAVVEMGTHRLHYLES